MGKFSDDLSRRIRRKPEDKNLAREAVERDRRRFAETLVDLGVPTRRSDGAQASHSSDEAPDLISMEIGARDNLTPAAAAKKGAEWRDLVTRYPEAHFIAMIDGYNDDPRALWDFPEVCEYMQHWAAAAGIGSVDDMPSVDPSIVDFFAACGVFGPTTEAQVRAELRQADSDMTEH
jgi:hypothetical protein